MRRTASLLLTLVLGAASLLIGLAAVWLSALPYNGEGRYFDASEGVVHTDSAPVAYGLLALLLTMATLLAVLWTVRVWRG